MTRFTKLSPLALAAFFPLALSLPLAPVACGDDGLADHRPPLQDGGGGGACVPEDSLCDIEFSFPLNGEQSVALRGDWSPPESWDVGVPMSIDGGRWRTSIAVPDGTTIRYKFFVNGSQWVPDPANPSKEPDGFGSENSLRTAQCDKPACDPVDSGKPVVGTFDWRSAVMYFVFVDRFRNGDPSNDAPLAGIEGPANYQGGDYAGLLKSIEEGYFDELGVNCLWLTVPMNNPNVSGAGSDGHAYSAYHGYWPTDLDKVEEHFGDLALLKKVVDAAHERGMKVLLDYAMNHVHKDAPIYAEHKEWFYPLEYGGKNYCVCGDGCDWNDSYEQRRCWFRDYLPDWNFELKEARDFSVGNAIDWIKQTGIDGFRLDAVKHIETSWISDLRTRVTAEIEPASGEHFYMVGETFESGNRDVIKKYMGPALLDGQFDFPLRAVVVEKILRRTGTMFDLDGFLATNDTFYGDGIMSTFIGNHDIARVIHVAEDNPWDAWAHEDKGFSKWGNTPPLPGNSAPFERLAVAFTLLFTTKGIPLIYYGDEIGLPGAGDPDNRRFMQWTGWNPAQTALRDRLKKLGEIRRDHPALYRGTRLTTSVTNDTYGFKMVDGADIVYVALNRSDSPGGVTGMPEKGRDLLDGSLHDGPSVTVPARGARIIVAE
jgi:glycosidase